MRLQFLPGNLASLAGQMLIERMILHGTYPTARAGSGQTGAGLLAPPNFSR
jgi:hypothetical protein